ncbi:MAG: hypothetical protein GX442_00725 [Candidatus Riflebacteria bacterium]|nr:hypothetical protein [Candidatus Riflebacteria bacterium]
MTPSPERPFPCPAPGLMAGRRQGIVSAMVVLVIVVLAILMVQFHQVARQSQSTTLGLEQREIAHQMVEVAMEEAFTRLLRESLDAKSAGAAWMIRKDSQAYALPTPFASKKIQELARSNQDPVLEADATIIQSDFRAVDSRGNKYYGSEGVGSIRLSVRLWILSSARSNGRPPYAELIRCHDYKVVSVRTKRDNGVERNAYAQNFPLDYALLVRKGFEEFNASPFGKNLDNDAKRLVIAQTGAADTQGKVLIGGTGSDKPVFLNVHEKFAPTDGSGLVPKPSKETMQVTFDDCLVLFPKLKEEIKKAVDQALGDLTANTPEGADPPSRETVESQIMEKLRAALYGIFTFRHLPMVRDSYSGTDLEEEKRVIDLVASKESGAKANTQRGIEIIGDSLAAFSSSPPDQILEGDIRSRFLKRVDFRMEGKEGGEIDAATIEKLKKDTATYCTEAAEGDDGTALVNGLRELSQKYSTDLFSRFIASYPYKTGLAGDPAPGFKTFSFRNVSGAAVPLETSGDTGVQPFFHVNLRGKRMETSDELAAVGIIDADKGTINLNGYADVQDSVTIGQAGQTLKVKGQGGIFSAKGSITINANIVKESDEDFCVFFTRKGNIVVNADEVQASLVAMGSGGGRIGFNKPVKVKGAVVAEYLSLDSWAAGTHTFTYDPVLKSRSQDLYVVNLGQSITFQRLVDGIQ